MTHILTPSTGAMRASGINLNRLRLRPGDRVVYWSPAKRAYRVDVIDAYSDQSGNWFTIDGEPLIVTNIHARVPAEIDARRVQDAFAEAVRVAGRHAFTPAERTAICDAAGLPR